MRIITCILIMLFGMGACPASEIACSSICVLVPFAAGGPTDIVARITGTRLEKNLQKPVVIENRPGTSGNLGSASVARAKADGCTLLVNGGLLATYRNVFSNLDYDPLADLVVIGGYLL